MSTIQYFEIPGTSSTAHQIHPIQVKQDDQKNTTYQIVALPTTNATFSFSTSPSPSPSSSKRSTKSTKTKIDPEAQQSGPLIVQPIQIEAANINSSNDQPIYQLVSIPEDAFDCKNNQPLIIQLPDNGQFQNIQAIQMPQQSSIEAESQSQQLGVDLANGAGMPVQLINLGDGTAFIPIGNAPFFPLSEEANSPEEQNDVQPIYVNEKQYNRIMKRREARMKLEQEGRLPKERRKYLHESRHRHAQNRVRREGGKFDSSQSHNRDEESSRSSTSTPISQTPKKWTCLPGSSHSN